MYEIIIFGASLGAAALIYRHYNRRRPPVEKRRVPSMSPDMAKVVDQRGHIMANELFEYADAVVILISVNDKQGNEARTHLFKWCRGDVHAQMGLCQAHLFERSLETNSVLIANIARSAAQPPPEPPNIPPEPPEDPPVVDPTV
jgi:hypothetical protein